MTRVHGNTLTTGAKASQQPVLASQSSSPISFTNVPSLKSSQQNKNMDSLQKQGSEATSQQIQKLEKQPPTSGNKKVDCDQSSASVLHTRTPRQIMVPPLCDAPDYREKYNSLLDLEEQEHSRILAKRLAVVAWLHPIIYYRATYIYTVSGLETGAYCT